MADLEGKLGELSGKIDLLIPTLATIADKIDRDAKKIAVLETEMIEVKATLLRSGARWWDIIKIVLAILVPAVIGAVAARVVMGGMP